MHLGGKWGGKDLAPAQRERERESSGAGAGAAPAIDDRAEAGDGEGGRGVRRVGCGQRQAQPLGALSGVPGAGSREELGGWRRGHRGSGSPWGCVNRYLLDDSALDDPA